MPVLHEHLGEMFMEYMYVCLYLLCCRNNVIINDVPPPPPSFATYIYFQEREGRVRNSEAMHFHLVKPPHYVLLHVY